MPFTLQIGEKAPDFSLKSTENKIISLKNFDNSPFLVIFFTCNHCPYVIHSNESTKNTALKYQSQGVSFVGINSNSPNTYTEDSFLHMVELMKQEHFPWFYLYDETQDVARSYGALRTPHFFVFDQNRELVYTGRAVDSPRDPSTIQSYDLENALDDLVAQREVKIPVTNPIGCNVKWEGKDKKWMPPEACDLV